MNANIERNIEQNIVEVLTKLNIQPVLLDIGASDAPPPQWAAIARKAFYIGFDPDQRDLHELPEGQYARSIIVNAAVTSVAGQDEISFHLTATPHCSSTLLPDTKSLANYLFADFFRVERDVKVRATTLDKVIEELGVQHVDWFKTDSQGTDLRLFQSLNAGIRGRVLAVDIEPGIIDAYQGEDLFIDAHRELIRQGFWLSTQDVRGTVRMRRDTLQAISRQYPQVQDSLIYHAVRPSPAWYGARYLRTLESLAEQKADSRSYALLWVFSMIEEQWGYALDIALAYQQRFGHDGMSARLFESPMAQLIKAEPRLRFKNLVKSIVPQGIRTSLRRLLAQ